METITTEYGEFVPQHTANELRKKEILPIVYHDNGTIRSLPLENQTSVSTPAGEIPAELITFHENGKVNRVFPLNGKLSGYWSQDDEAALAKPVHMETPIGPITCRIISIGFFDNGMLRSITIWPGDSIKVSTPVGVINTRVGLSFHPDGSLHSVEPEDPTPVTTPIGEITAFDPDAVGVNGDCNSLSFTAKGELTSVTTTLTKVKIVHPDGHMSIHAPETRESLCGDDETEIVPMQVRFSKDELRIRTDPDAPPLITQRKGHLFFAEPHIPQIEKLFGGLRCSV